MGNRKHILVIPANTLLGSVSLMASINDQKKQENLNQENNNVDDTKLPCSDKSEDDRRILQSWMTGH